MTTVHRHTMEQHLGRPLLKMEQVHHVNADIYDNRIQNLMIMSASEHGKLHGPQSAGRTTCGEKHPMAKLTDREVVEIRDLYKAKTYTSKQLAEVYRTTKRNIQLIVSGRTRKNLL